MSTLNAAFDDAHTKIMGDAFDAICSRLHGTAYPDAVKEAIALRIIDLERSTAETDPRRLADAVVASLGIKV